MEQIKSGKCGVTSQTLQNPMLKDTSVAAGALRERLPPATQPALPAAPSPALLAPGVRLCLLRVSEFGFAFLNSRLHILKLQSQSAFPA